MDMLSWALDQIVVSDRRTSRRCCQAREQQDLLRVFRHVYVPTDRVAGAPDKWEAARRATALRIAAVARVLGPSAVFVGEAAAVLHGIDTVTELIDVHVCVPCIPRTAPVVLPPLLIPGHGPVSGTIPPAAVVRHLTTIDEKWILEKAPGVRVVDLATAGAMCAQDLPARSGSVVVSGLLRRMSSFDRFWEKAEASRVREEAARRQILDRLEELSSRRGRRRARVVIAAADAACESVPERVLLWVLKSGGFTGVHTQVHHRV